MPEVRFDKYYRYADLTEIVGAYAREFPQLVRGCLCEIELPEGAKLLTGKLREDVGQLEGRTYQPSAPLRRQADPTSDPRFS
ncbi:hypothetical protein B7486_42685 [cyanobacterium TDX16]|nr:hypothetical protein B7486_42685 [cyanobacterium TDX16]